MSDSPSRLLARIVDPVRRLYASDMPEPDRWSCISDVLDAEQADTDRTAAIMVRSARVGEFAHRRLNPDTGETYDHPGPHQIPYDL